MRKSFSRLTWWLVPLSLSIFHTAPSFATDTCSFEFMISKGRGQPLESCTAVGTGKDAHEARLDAEGACAEQIGRGHIVTTAMQPCDHVGKHRSVSSQEAGAAAPNGG